MSNSSYGKQRDCFLVLRCREEKGELEVEYEARLREMDEKHQHELQELENMYQQQIMGEVERYQVITVIHRS